MLKLSNASLNELHPRCVKCNQNDIWSKLYNVFYQISHPILAPQFSFSNTELFIDYVKFNAKKKKKKIQYTKSIAML